MKDECLNQILKRARLVFYPSGIVWWHEVGLEWENKQIGAEGLSVFSDLSLITLR
jgi:hypothetical protein